MVEKIIKEGTYTVMGPGGQLTDLGQGLVLLRPGASPSGTQVWDVAFEAGSYTLRNRATRRFLGNEGDPNLVAWRVSGCDSPFGWYLRPGDDAYPNTCMMTSAKSTERLRLAPSILRIWPPQVAIAPATAQFDFEWTFQPA
ncbi:MAG TPA: hypothetical protein VMA95_01240 [Streptosporangiaceae bacterium]|nr:hypothetical protein [Streptosporangiaceae bacterium]